MNTVKDLIVKIETLKSNQNFSAAIKLLEKSIMKYSSDYRLYEELADIYLYKWELKKWLKSINFALTLNKESATWNYLKWFILLSQDKVVESIKFLEKSNKLLWNNSEVLRNLWWAYNLSGNTAKGITLLKRALIIAPNDELISEDLAMALIWNWHVEEWNTLLQKIWKKIYDLKI